MSKKARPLAKRFWEKVDKKGPVARPGLTPCWLWTASTFHVGTHYYGKIGVDGRTMTAHRVAYILGGGSIPSGMLVRHICDVSLCVKPAHLRLGTVRDNVNDRVRRGRGGHGEVRGAASPHTSLTEAQVATIRARCARGEKQKIVAAAYGVTPATVSKMVLRRTWRLPLARLDDLNNQD